MSVEAISAVLHMAVKPSSHKFVLFVLANFANEEWESYPSVKVIAEITSLDRKTILSALHDLTAQGYIALTGKKAGATRQIPIYQIQREKLSQKRNSSKNGTVPKTEQSRFSHETVPFLGHPPSVLPPPPSALPSSPSLSPPSWDTKGHEISPRVEVETSTPPHDTNGKKGLTPEILVELYNTHAPAGLPRVTRLSEARRKKAQLYIRQLPDVAFWLTVFSELSKSNLLLGLKPSQGHEYFHAHFDWLLSKGKADGVENCVKVAEGKFRDGPNKRRTAPCTHKGAVPIDVGWYSCTNCGRIAEDTFNTARGLA